MQAVVKELNETLGEQRIYRTEAFATTDKLLDDHVHLNEKVTSFGTTCCTPAYRRCCCDIGKPE